MTARKILIPALPLAFVVIVLGAFTRLSDAGLGCPDWPACYGQLIGVPDSQTAQIRHPDSPLDPEKAWIEVIHRYAAAILGIVVLGALIVAFRRREKHRPAVLALAVLVVAQAILGALTVTQKLNPAIVVSHLLGGMSIFFLIAFIIAPAPPPPPFSRPALSILPQNLQSPQVGNPRGFRPRSPNCAGRMGFRKLRRTRLRTRIPPMPKRPRPSKLHPGRIRRRPRKSAIERTPPKPTGVHSLHTPRLRLDCSFRHCRLCRENLEKRKSPRRPISARIPRPANLSGNFRRRV